MDRMAYIVSIITVMLAIACMCLALAVVAAR